VLGDIVVMEAVLQVRMVLRLQYNRSVPVLVVEAVESDMTASRQVLL